jgi:hypothetical protein
MNPARGGRRGVGALSPSNCQIEKRVGGRWRAKREWGSELAIGSIPPPSPPSVAVAAVAVAAVVVAASAFVAVATVAVAAAAGVAEAAAAAMLFPPAAVTVLAADVRPGRLDDLVAPPLPPPSEGGAVQSGEQAGPRGSQSSPGSMRPSPQAGIVGSCVQRRRRGDELMGLG